MGLNWIEIIVYSLVSGIAEFLPVSSKAHQALVLQLFGADGNTTFLDLFLHFGMLFAVLVSCHNQVAAINRTRRLLQIPRRRRKRRPDLLIVSRLRLLKTAAVPVLILTLFFKLTGKVVGFPLLLGMCLILNGVLLYIPAHVSAGNKDARDMTRFDGMLIGFVSGLGIVPGISRMGAGLSLSRLRGAEAQEGLAWCLLLSIPGLAALCVADIFLIAWAGIGYLTFVVVLKCLVGAVFAYLGAFVSIALLRFMAVKVGFTCFSYYSWGIALLTLILYMI